MTEPTTTPDHAPPPDNIENSTIPEIEPPLYAKDQPIGDSLLLPKPHDITRIIIQNPNGFSVGPGGTLPTLLESTNNAEADIALFPEINIDTTQQWVTANIHNTCKRVFQPGRFRTVLATSSIEFQSQYKPGGVMSLTVGDTIGRILSTGSDPLGRWAYTRLNGAAGRTITIIVTYQVCQSNVRTAGPTTAVSQQYSMLEQAKRHQPYRVRNHHTKDLCKFVNECKQQGDLVCVGGDFNETIGDNGGGLTRLCSDYGLLDPVFEIHGCTNFSTYYRGTNCIDYMLVDPELMPSIVACGYEPFNMRIFSDHRGLFLDVNTALFFGSTTTPLAPLNARDYTSKHIHNTHKYIGHLEDHLQHHKWFQKIQELKQCMDSNNRNDLLAEDLDQRRIHGCTFAGKQLKRYPAPPWSPELARLRNINSILLMSIRMKLFPEDDCCEAMEIRQAKLGSVGITIPETVEDCKKFQRENLKTLRATEAAELQNAKTRKNHQEATIAAYTDSGDTQGAKIIQRIRRAEATAEVFRQCAAIRGRTNAGGLTYVKVPVDPTMDPKQCQSDNQWRDVVDPHEVATAIRERLQKHFSQARDCNLTSPPFDITMNFDAACDRAEQILAGTYNTNELDDTTAAILDCFKSVVNGEVAVPYELSESALLGKIKAWSEKTSTSPLTGIHLGHAKAYIAQTTLTPKSDEHEEFQTKRSSIIQGHLILLNYALKFGYSYQRWQSIVNAMLEKDPGTPKIHRLRVIHLYEWDFNLLLCVKWRALLHHVCDNRLINKACYGTMPGHSSLDPVFIKEMEYEMARLTRRPLIHFDNDAASCYDRIPCFLANLASRKYGMAKQVCIVQARTLEQAKYYLKTKFGISEEYAQHTQQCPWFGTGQGSGNSPFYWLLISSTLYDVYCSKTTGGATYNSPDKTLTVKLHLLGFVDDVSNRTNLNPNVDSQELNNILDALIEQASRDSQLWHDILTGANQELELNKCKYHFVHFDFKPNGQPVMAEEPDPANPQHRLTITSRDGNPAPIQFVQSSKAIKYLGCQKCPGNQNQQKQSLQARCNDFARVINCSRLSRRGTQVFYQAIYRLSVSYPLPVCYFTFKELDDIQRRAHSAMVSHSGFNRYTAREVLFGPTYLGGANFFHLYDEQGYGQVSTFLKSWRTPNSHAGQILRITVAWAQYCIGTSTSFLTDTTTKLPHLESTWLTSLRQFLHAVGGTLELDHRYIPPLQRERDQHIMDVVLQSNKFQPQQIRFVNYCRLYLRVITVSDISNANGTDILTGMYQGQVTSINTNTSWNHVHQQRPGPRAWAQWRRACRLICSGSQLHLTTHLGGWVTPISNLRTQWKYWHCTTLDLLYHNQPDGTYCSYPRMHYDFDSDEFTAGVDLPPTAVPVDVQIPAPGLLRMQPHHNHWSLPGPDPEAPGPDPDEPEPLAEYIGTLPAWETQLLQHLTLQVDQLSLFAILQQEPFIVGSDGSQKGHRASFGWTISTAEGTRLATCQGPSLGARPHSYRAEGYGLLSVTRFLHHLRSFYQLQLQSCTIVCDNKAMVNRATAIPKHLHDLYPNSTLDSEWDILMEIWTTHNPLTPEQRPQIQHVKGHQDQQTPYDDLTLRAQLNCDADKLAEDFISTNPDLDYSTAPMLPNSRAQLHLTSGTISNKLKMELKLARTVEPLQEKLKEKFGWDHETFQSIDIECCRRALRRHGKNRVTLIKHLNDIIPIGTRVSRYDPKYPAACPSCPEPAETSSHLQTCSSPPRLEWRHKFLMGLRKLMESNNTPTDMIELMLEGLKAVLEDRDTATIHVPASVAHIAEAQQSIGWDHVLRGRLSKTWATAQQLHLGEFQPKTNGQTWATTIIQAILQGWLDLWHIRNGDRHGRDSQSKAQAAKAQAIRELEQLYELKEGVLPQHQWLLETPIQQRMNLKTYQLRAFINSFKPVLEESYKERLATG